MCVNVLKCLAQFTALNRVKSAIVSPRVAAVGGGAVMRRNGAVDGMDARLDAVAPDLERRCQRVVVWNDLFRAVFQDSAVVVCDGFSLLEGFIDASHEFIVMVVVGLDDKV